MLQHFDHEVKLHYILASDGCNITDSRGLRLRQALNKDRCTIGESFFRLNLILFFFLFIKYKSSFTSPWKILNRGASSLHSARKH